MISRGHQHLAQMGGGLPLDLANSQRWCKILAKGTLCIMKYSKLRVGGGGGGKFGQTLEVENILIWAVQNVDSDNHFYKTGTSFVLDEAGTN